MQIEKRYARSSGAIPALSQIWPPRRGIRNICVHLRYLHGEAICVR
jgi:hypothetical protein